MEEIEIFKSHYNPASTPHLWWTRWPLAAARACDCALNRIRIDRTTNQMISNRAPSASGTRP